MPLERQLVELPVQTGLGQKMDERLLQEGAQTGLVNLVQDKVGALQKRLGIVDLGIGDAASLNVASFSSARLLPTTPAGVAQINSGKIFARSATGAVDPLVAQNVSTVLADQFGIVSDVNPKLSWDLCSDGTRVWVAWIVQNQNGSSCQFAILDATNFNIIQTPSSFAPYGIPASLRLCMAGTTAVCLVETTDSVLSAYSWSAASQWSGRVQIVSDLNHTLAVSGSTFYGCWDCASVVGTNNFVVLYGNQGGSAGKPAVRALTYSGPPMVLQADSTYLTIAGSTSNWRIHGCAVVGKSGDRIWCAYAVNNTTANVVHAFGLDPTLMTVSAPVDTALWTEASTNLPERLSIMRLNVTPRGLTGPSALVVGNNLHVQDVIRGAVIDTITPAATTALMTSYNGLSIASKLFELNGKSMALFYYSGGDPTVNGATIFPSYFIGWVQTAQAIFDNTLYLIPEANISPRAATSGQVSSITYSTQMPATYANVTGPSSTQSILTLGETIESSAVLSGLDLLNVYYNYSLWQAAELGGVVYLSGGVPAEFDGRAVTEVGFSWQPPSTCAVALASTLGGNLSSYTYTYGIVYEALDNTGQRVQSAPTFLTYTSNSTTGIASVTCPALGLTTRYPASLGSYAAGQMAVAIYRDTQTSPGTLVRLFTGTIPTSQLFVAGTSTITYTDSNGDSSILNNEQLYTTGNVLPAQCAPSLKCLIPHNNRLVGIGGDGLIWFSTKWDEGTTVPYFNDNLTQAIADEGRPTALATMDGNLIVFKSKSIWVISGDGPANDGTGNTWTPPQRVTADVGCSTDWRSVVTFSQGVVFQNGTKMYLLSRGLEVSYFSGAVEDLLAANPVITGCALNAVRNELRFCCKPTETATTGVVLNFNYVTNTWSEFLYYDADAAVFGANIDACAVIGGRWYHTTFTGRVYQEGTGSLGSDYYWDGQQDQWIVATRETAWLKTQGIQGFGRVWNATVLETDFSPHDLTVSAAYNYSASYTQTATWTASEIASFTTAQPQMQMHLANQKVESVKFKISDGAPTGVAPTSGRGANIIGVTVEAGVKRGRFRIPEAQSK